MRGWRHTALALLPALAACGSSSAPVNSADAAARGCNAQWPVLAHRAGGQPVQLPPGAALPLACAGETGFATSESGIAVTRGGALIYSPAQSENTLARSTDDGASWTLAFPADAQPTSFWNTVDPYLVADRRTGRVFWSHATGPLRSEDSLPQGLGFYLAGAFGFQVYASDDEGRSWRTADYSTALTGDWEQVMVGPPPPAASGAAQPAGYPDLVYLCANSPVEGTGPGRLCYKSLDGGASFVVAGYVSPTAANPAEVCPPLDFNNGVVDGAGTLYVPATCSGGGYVIISRDEGSSWRWTRLAGAPPGPLTSGNYLQLAVDDADNLYALWPQGNGLVLEISRDRAGSWSAPLQVAAPGVHGAHRPALAAGAPGQVSVTYYASTDPRAQMLSAYITQTRDALDAQPLFYSGVVNDPARPIFQDFGLTQERPRADFVGGAYDATGMAFWAGLVKQLGPADANGNVPTTGYVAHLLFNPTTPTSLP